MAASLLHRVRERAKRTVPRRFRPLATRALQRVLALALRGDRVACSCCGGTFRRFLAYPSLYCPRCGSYERHRALCLLLEREPGLVAPPVSLLHIGPEPALARRLRRPGVDYVSIDLDYPLATHRMDARRMTFPDASFGVVVCLHVFEAMEDVEAALPELYRVTRPGGTTILQVPGHLDDARPGIASRLGGAGFEVVTRQPGRELGADACARYGLEPGALVHLARRPAVTAPA